MRAMVSTNNGYWENVHPYVMQKVLDVRVACCDDIKWYMLSEWMVDHIWVVRLFIAMVLIETLLKWLIDKE